MMQGFFIKQQNEVTIYVNGKEVEPVKYAVEKLAADMQKVFDAKVIVTDEKNRANIIVATAEVCTLPYHDDLRMKDGRWMWEGFHLQVSDNIFYICGADKRGTVYGIYEMSQMLGVSPWYYFADVPVKKREEFCLQNGFSKVDYPSVKYRGIFINDEEELEAWAIQHFGESTIGPKSYEHIFELLLRLKANYIWPAMHVNAFNNDKENGRLAHKMGLIVGTSHCDMLLRSNQNEWKPWLLEKGYENIKYDYSIEGTNKEIIKEYWRESVEQNKDYDVSYTVGMRGIHDSGFITGNISADETLTEAQKKEKKVRLLEKVMEDQRNIIREVTGKETTLQTFIPYKEVLNLYDEGLQVPDDITLVWVNDNFGYMRRYPNEEEQKRSGGHGLYYHASYWAHPGMSYLFFNSTPPAHMKNELCKAYENGIQKMWVLNAGAIKPLEIDIEFFIRYAWEINKNEEQTRDVIRFLVMWLERNFTIKDSIKMAEVYHSFLQITNVRKPEHMKNGIFAQEVMGNEGARRMVQYRGMFEITYHIHKSLPAEEQDAFFQMVAMKIYAAYFINASFYFGDRSILMYENKKPYLAEKYTFLSRQMDEYKRRLLYYYNEGMQNGKWNKILTPESFLPPCTALYPACKPALVLTGTEEEDDLTEKERALRKEIAGEGFIENNGYISILASHYLHNSGWKKIEHSGYYEGDLMEAKGGVLEYEMTMVSEGEFLLELYRFPTLHSTGRIRLGISIDDGPVLQMESLATDEWRDCWKNNVMNNVEKMYLTLPWLEKGSHRLKIHAIDPYVAFSKIVIYTRGYVPSKLGPAESLHKKYNPVPDEKTYEFNSDMEKLDVICKELFLCEKAPLPEVIYADKEFWKKERLYLKNVVKNQKTLGDSKYGADAKGRKNVFDKFGHGRFTEKNGILAFGTEYVLEQSEYAHVINDVKGIGWEHTQSESDGRTGIAMYIPNENCFWEKYEQAPSMNYSIFCSGGKYHLWLLLKYDDEPNAEIGIALDDKEIPRKQLYNEGHLFNYGTQQNWVWMTITELEMTPGDHIFTLYAKASEIRIDRVYLTKGEEYPPIDCEWMESERK